MGEEKERFLPKFLRDAILTIIGGLVIEPTLQRIHLDVGPYLRQIWFGIFAFLTLDAFWRSHRVRQWSVATYSNLTPRRKVVSYLVVSLIGIGCFSLYWFLITRAVGETERKQTPEQTLDKTQTAQTQQPPAPSPPQLTSQDKAQAKAKDAGPLAKALSPYTRTESFIIDIPYYGAEDGFPVTRLLGNDDYRLNEAYGCISGILVLYAAHVPPGTGIKQITELDTVDKRSEALTQALRYCLIEEIHQRERGSSKFGISAEKGSIAEYNPAITPPDSSDYPPERFLGLLSTLPFGSSPGIQMLYKYRPLRVPRGSTVELAVLKIDPNDWMQHRVLRIEKPNVFSFIVGAAPINAAVGAVPESFPDALKLQKAKYVTYSFAVTMKIEIARTPNNGAEVEDFKAWSSGLWAALRAKFDVRQPA